ncbi:DUF4232 domain-containing protein [Corynebacterium sp. CCM 9203]|uniref:DUF4232 domain-containing protein n=1 Tax=Corynebacterium sp. CCM 9203 TaxID=3057615 RepID=UPI003523C3B1
MKSHSSPGGNTSHRLRTLRIHNDRSLIITAAALAVGSTLITGCIGQNASEVSLMGDTGTDHITTSGSAPSSPELPDVSPICSADRLTATIDSTSAGAGHTFHVIRLTNIGDPCTLSGYPGVSLIDATGSQVGAASDRESGAEGSPALLYTGGSAVFSVSFSQPYAYGRDICEPTERARQLKIYPPNDTGWLTVPMNEPTCGSEQVSTISVTGVKPG